MEDSSIAVLIVLLAVIIFLTLVVIGLFTVFKWLVGLVAEPKSETNLLNVPKDIRETHPCPNCGYSLIVQLKFCGVCGAQRLTLQQEEQVHELEITLRQLELLNKTGPPDGVSFRVLKTRIESERERMLFPHGKPGAARQHSLFEPETRQTQPPAKPVERGIASPPPKSDAAHPPFLFHVNVEKQAAEPSIPRFADWSQDSDRPARVTDLPKAPRKPFTDVLAAFMEESNVRWGEIIGGLLIIGCSTALVISLWAQISRVPVMKFFIFTTITAALFGVGFYTEHHWKLPTTSRGILTIATLLVPLNFLAIAAVSANSTPGILVIGSEILAPAIFLCLVYFAGRTITSKWPHVLAAGALGSSVGQLLVRHFAAPDVSATVLFVLGAVSLLFYVGASGWALKIALADGEIDELEAIEILTTLGALTFAAALPFGLLLYKSGPVGISMMHLAPLVTLAGMPMLASGMLLWQRVSAKELAAMRTAGASIAILGSVTALAGMVLAWPNPASIVPAALFNFLLFTIVAVALAEPRAHVVATACLTLGYVVAFHVFAHHVPWQNLRVASLLRVTNTVSTGQSLVVPFVAFLLAYEWLRSQRPRDALTYLSVLCAAVLASVLFLLEFGAGIAGDPFYVSAIVALYAGGLLWLAWRTKRAAFTWAGAGLLFFASAQVCHSLISVQSPWQASALLFALVCCGGALVPRSFRTTENERVFVKPLQTGAILAVVVGVLLLALQLVWFRCEPAVVFAGRAFVLAAVLLGLLIISRRTVFFTGFQIALVVGTVLLTKFALQHFAWHGFHQHAWLHPWALQTQGVILGSMCLGWMVARLLARSMAAAPHASDSKHWFARILFDTRWSFDQLLAAALATAFVLVVVIAAANGVAKELTSATRTPLQFNLAGQPHEQMFGLGSFALLAVLLATMFGTFLERGKQIFAIGTVLTLWAICPLVAGLFESQSATASAGRWMFALFLLIVSFAYAMRERLGLAAQGLSQPGNQRRTTLASSRAVLLVITLLPLALLTLSPVVDDINHVPGRGPQSGIFKAMSAVILYGVPLTVSAAALAIHAARERSPTFAFAGGLLINFAVTAVHIVSVAEVGGPMDRAALVKSLQLNAMAAAGVALIWMATRVWWMKTEVAGSTERSLLNLERILAVSLNAIVILPVALLLIALPERVGRATFAAGAFNGWLAALLTIAAVFAFAKVFTKTVTCLALTGSMFALVSLAAFRVAQFGVANWAGLHVLVGALIVIAWMLLLARDLPRSRWAGRLAAGVGMSFDNEWTQDAELSTAVVAALVVLIALRGPFSDPLGASWSIGALLTMSALAVSLNWVTLRRAYVYAAAICFSIAISIWLIKYQTQVHSFGAFIEVNVIALSLTGVLWLYLELRSRKLTSKPGTNNAASFHNIAAVGSLIAIGILTTGRLQNDFLGYYQTLFPLLDTLTLAALVVFMAACLWDREAKYAVAGLYVIGLLIAATVVHHGHLAPRYLVWWLVMAAVVQSILAASVWHARDQVVGGASRLRIPLRIDPEATELVWLLAFNSVVAANIIAVVFAIELNFREWSLRSLAAIAVAAQCVTFALMAEGQRRRVLQRAAVAVFLIGVVFLSWSFLTPGVNGTWLNRAVLLMGLMFAAVALFGLELDKLIEREPDWTRAFRDCVPAVTVAGIVALVFILCTEIYQQVELGAVNVNLPALIAVAVTLATAAIVCIMFALSPRHDPLNLPEQWRGAYVYAAEVVLVLLFMHIRLTMPWLFHGFFQRYWPLVVLAIAYAGVGIAEFFKRQGIPVLARPIERTGAFLPLLPVIGFWIAQSQVQYSTLLFVVGGLYGLLSILRRSFWFGLAAALAGNGGLWYLLHETSDYQFYQHPQIWLIPVAISVLIAAHLNRKDFSESQMTSIRYLCLMTIYVSSTADIFINGVASSPWLPLVLAALSLAGVFAGMIFRVRAFLLLGSIFLLLAIATVIKYASVNFGWTWLWYVAGIVTGAIIITTFAVFEKRRADVLRVVDGFKEWKG